MKEVTDPALLEQLNAPTEVTDPGILAQLNGEPPHPSQSEAELPAARGTPTPDYVATLKPGFASNYYRAAADATPRSVVEKQPQNFQGEIRNSPERPHDYMQPVAEQISPTMGGYAMGHQAAAAYQAARDGDAKAFAENLAPIIIGMAAGRVVPGGGRSAAGETAAASEAIPSAAGKAAEVAPAAAGVGNRDAALRSAPGSKEAALQAAQRIGVDVPKAAAGGYASRAVGAALKDVPVVGEPLVQASDKALGQLEGAVNRVADEQGGSSSLSAGYAMKDNVVDWVKNVSKDEAEAIYKPVRDMIGGAKAPLTNTQDAIQRLTQDAAEIGQPPPAVVNYLNAAVGRGPLNFEQMQRLRTEVGDRISGNIVPEPGQNKTALKVAYKALTEDIDALAASAGDKAKVAWQQANDAFRTQIAAKRDALTKVVGIEGEANPELVAQRLTTMASAKRGADIDRLRLARETASPEAWGELASSVTANLGRTKDGFSISRFRTDYANLSDAGKDLLFSPEHRQALDDVAMVSKRFENLDRLANHSRTAVSGTIFGAGYSAIKNPLQVLATALGGRGLAAMLARPATARATANWAKSYAALEEHATEQTLLVARDAAMRMRDAMEREGIPAYPALSALIADQPLNGDEHESDQ